jgi:hypothetical protein
MFYQSLCTVFLFISFFIIFTSCEEQSQSRESKSDSVISFFSLGSINETQFSIPEKGKISLYSSDFNEPLLRYYKCYSLISGVSPNPEERDTDRSVINYLKSSLISDELKHEIAVNACIDLLNLAQLSGADSSVALNDSTDELQKSILKNINNFHKQWFTNGSPFSVDMNGALNHHESFPGALRLTHNLLTQDSSYKNILRGTDSFFGIRDKGIQLITHSAFDSEGIGHDLHFPDVFSSPESKNSNYLLRKNNELALDDNTENIYLDYSVSPKMMQKVFSGINLLGEGDQFLENYDFDSRTLIYNISDPINTPLIEEAFSGINTSLIQNFNVSESDIAKIKNDSEGCSDANIYLERGELIGIKTKNVDTCKMTHFSDRFKQPDNFEVGMFHHPGAGGALDISYLLKNIESSQDGETLSLRHTNSDRFARRWARYLLLDWLCLDIPNLGPSDVIEEHIISDSLENHTFLGNSASCMICHSSIDPLSRAIAPIRIGLDGVPFYPRYDNRDLDTYTDENDLSRYTTTSFLSPTNSILLEYESDDCTSEDISKCNIGCMRNLDGDECVDDHFKAANLDGGYLDIYRLSETIWPTKSQEKAAVFLSRAPMYGELNINDVNGDPIRDPIYSFKELGISLSSTNAFYACAAKRYVQYFTGEDIELFYPDASDPNNKIIGMTELEKEKLNWIINDLGKSLYDSNINNFEKIEKNNIRMPGLDNLTINKEQKVTGPLLDYKSVEGAADIVNGETINSFQVMIKEIISSKYFMESILGSDYSQIVEYESLGDVVEYYDNLESCFSCHSQSQNSLNGEGDHNDLEPWAPSIADVGNTCASKLSYLRSLVSENENWRGHTENDIPLITPGEPCQSRIFTSLSGAIEECAYVESHGGDMQDMINGFGEDEVTLVYDFILNFDGLNCDDSTDTSINTNFEIIDIDNKLSKTSSAKGGGSSGDSSAISSYFNELGYCMGCHKSGTYDFLNGYDDVDSDCRNKLAFMKSISGTYLTSGSACDSRIYTVFDPNDTSIDCNGGRGHEVTNSGYMGQGSYGGDIDHDSIYEMIEHLDELKCD